MKKVKITIALVVLMASTAIATSESYAASHYARRHRVSKVRRSRIARNSHYQTRRRVIRRRVRSSIAAVSNNRSQQTANNCGIPSPESRDNIPNTAPICYGASFFSGRIDSPRDTDWRIQVPLISGRQIIRVTKTSNGGWLKAAAFKDGKHFGSPKVLYSATSNTAYFVIPLDKSKIGERLLHINIQGSTGTTYEVQFYGIR